MNAAKEFFEKCRYLDQRVVGLLEQSERIRALALRTTAVYSDVPRGGGGPQSKIENAVVRLVELENELNAAIDELADHRFAVLAVLEAMSDPRYRDILDWRYNSLWSWDKITATFGFEDRTQVWRLHGRALQEANALLVAKRE